MVQQDLEIENTAYTGPTHAFASCAFGWATAETREAAIEKLLNGFRRDITSVVKNAQKQGEPGMYFWSVIVEAPQESKYEINFYAPQGVGLRKGEHHYWTHVTQKQAAYCTTDGAVNDYRRIK